MVKNGIEFESKVRESQRSNRKFDFLNPGHAFNNYYKQKYQISKYPKARILAEKYQKQKDKLHSTQQNLLGLNDDINNNNNDGNNINHNENGIKSQQNKPNMNGISNNNNNISNKSGIITHKLTLKQRIMQELALAKKPKCEYIRQHRYSKFIVPLPTKRSNITSYEISIIKLVAQFTACIGKSFIRDLQRNEPDNETFGFLSPMHPRFQYFQRLVDSYSNIIDQFEDYKEYNNRDRHRDRHKRRGDRGRDRDRDRERMDYVSRFKQLNLDRDKIWYESIGSAEWTNREKEKEAKYLKDEEDERRANALIDWQSFTVLETIDFENDNDQTQLVPPGKTIEEIDAILDTTLDVEADINEPILAHDQEEDMDLASSDDEMDMDEDSDKDNDESNKNQTETSTSTKNIDIEMEKEQSEQHRKQIAKAKVAVKLKSTPMPAPKGVILSTDLDEIPTMRMETEEDIELRLKLEKILNDSRNEQLENQQCPICNEFVAIKHLSKHIQIELLDPKWKEQKESLKVRLSQTTLASNQQISENLMKFSREHAAQLGVNNNNNNNKDKDNNLMIPPKPQWDGHKDSLAEQKKLAALHDEIEKQKQKEKEKEKEKQRQKEQENAPTAATKPSENKQGEQKQNQPQPPPPTQQNVPPPHPPSYPPMPPHGVNPYMNPYGRVMHNPLIPHPHPPQFRPPHHGAIHPPMPPPPGHHPGLPAMLPPHHPLHHHPPFMPHHAQQRRMNIPPNMPHPPPPQQQQIPQQPPQQQPMRVHAPPSKKVKLNDGSAMNTQSTNNNKKQQPDGLINENDFISQNGGIGQSVKIKIIVPRDDKKKQFKFNGQTLTFTMKLNENIKELKQRIFNVLTLPINKQKLRIKKNGIWVKDISSLAFYNINSSSILELSTRTRGGKKNK